jgi:GTP cyclohydrolase I
MEKTPKEKARDLVNTFYCALPNNGSQEGLNSTTSRYQESIQCALIAVNEVIKYHESLFDKGFKEVHIALSSPVKTYNDILNPLLNYWQSVKKQIELL